MSCVEVVARIKEIEQAEVSRDHRTACKLVRRFVFDCHIDPKCRLVNSVLSKAWTDVMGFFELVENEKDVNRYVSGASSRFATTAKNAMLVEKFQLSRSTGTEVPWTTDEHVSPGQPGYLKLLKGAGILLAGLCLLFVCVWAMHVLLVLLGSSKKEEAPSCQAQLNHLKQTMTEHTERVHKMNERLVLQETGAGTALAAGNLKLEQALAAGNRELERVILTTETSNALIVGKLKRAAEETMSAVKTSVDVLKDKIGDLKSDLTSAQLNASTVKSLLDSQEKTVQVILAKVDPLTKSLKDSLTTADSLEQRVVAMENNLELAQGKLDHANHLWLYMLLGGAAFVVLVGVYFNCVLEIKVQKLKELEEVKFCLVSSHQLSGRMIAVETRVKALESPADAGMDQPARGPAAPARR